MAEPSDVRPDRATSAGAYSDRAAKRRSEPGLSRRMAHVIHGAATGAALSAAGLHVSDHPIPTLTVMTASAVGSAIVGSAHERHGERQGREAGLQEGRRQGRAAAMREARQERSSGRRFLPGRAKPGNRDRGGR